MNIHEMGGNGGGANRVKLSIPLLYVYIGHIETKNVCRDCRQAGKSAGRQLLVYRDQECVQGLQACRQVGRQATISI